MKARTLSLSLIAIPSLVMMQGAEAASVQLYNSFPIIFGSPDPTDQDGDTFHGTPIVTTTPTFEIPDDFDDNNPIVFPGSDDLGANFGAPNGLDEDQDGVIDGNFGSLGPFTFATVGDIIVAPGDGFTTTLNITGIDSPNSLILQAFATGTVFDKSAREISWTSSVDDAGSTFLFSVVAAGGVGPSQTIQRQFNVTVASATAIPEPSSALLFGLGALGFAVRRRRR